MMFTFAATIVLLTSMKVITSQDCEFNAGLRQSPINIKTQEAIPLVLPPLQWSTGYNMMPENITLINDGSSLHLSVESSVPLYLKTPLTSVAYDFNNIHFHWGDGEDNNKGSEHYINGHFYPLEMHAVHRQTVSNATDQFLVVAYLFQLSRQKNPFMERIVDAISDATLYGNCSVQNFKLINLLYNVPFSYFTYEGSLTTPPYTESVVFLVASTYFPITKQQLEVFQRAAAINPGLRNNYRCLQDLNQRKIMHILLPSY